MRPLTARDNRVVVRTELSIEIEAPSARVWRALCDPDDVVQWDSGVMATLNAPPDYPKPGQVVHWRLRSSIFRTLVDRPQVVEPEQVLRSLLSFGPFRLDETYTIMSTASGCTLAVSVDATCSLPFLDGLLERYYLGPMTQRDFGASLASIKRHCETHY